jgi:hypothetical protein
MSSGLNFKFCSTLDVETVCSAAENLQIVQLTVTCFQQALCPVIGF